MSSRYGRNQKRRHREEIARVGRELDVAVEMLVRRGQKITELERRLAKAVEISIKTEHVFQAKAFDVTARFDAPADVQVVKKRIDELSVQDFLLGRSQRVAMAQRLAERIVDELPGGYLNRG